MAAPMTWYGSMGGAPGTHRVRLAHGDPDIGVGKIDTRDTFLYGFSQR